ncbi:TonB-dependent receptor plug domain-containing protein [Mucilaginibacter sp. L3T2-6]|uniref:TonB-dependent receptor plug domain-containing protein n=1 Tax=Mucilaginibacter sp. L3T2-6 TaxID=3062491 RepID=UPI00267630C7|nr:TonB-dependent receptor plug domain-containing protein [Mucilaginibacter sp. L3T2-6]MDO3640582.1 TonB-dependent receptor plug domain-containing protein [Mucilaginibacter sp. L3T2-6]MDV6213079.1 TonB-dependent receptor plug domain-containing protein [Mucilaginibacter sp. L3T2-6]
MKKIVFTLILFVTVHAIVFGQGTSPVLENAVSKIKATITDHIIEKAYLQLDRSYACYVAGETIYFKAYVTMGELHQPSTISGILHVDLIGSGNNLLQTKAISLANGVGWGDFSLPDTLQKGSYRIRAYTNYMRNADRAYFFEKYISVGSPNSVSNKLQVAKKTGQPSVQFFPEGGNLVTDIHTRVAFKAIGADGLGINLKGIIVDNNDQEVAKIESSHFGMGTFDFIPEEGKKYIAKLIYADGSKATVNLPAAAAKGIVLAVNTDEPTKLGIEIRANRAYYKENMNKDINLLVYWSGSVKKVNTKLDNQVLGLDIPTANMMTGIVQVTLFSETGEPLSERLAFVQNKDILGMTITSSKPTYAKRENVVLNLNAKTKDGNPARGSFSASVVDESKIAVDENAETTILTSLLLTADLKGYVENPNYYFANMTNETRSNLDALMLTQGYRRFVWKQLLSDNQAATALTYKPERVIDLTGSVKTRTGEPKPNLTVTMVQGPGGLKTATTDAEGKFRFTDMFFETGSRIVLKVDSKSGKNALVIALDKPAAVAPVGPGSEMAVGYNGNADILGSLQNSQRGGLMTASDDQKVYLKNERANIPKKNDNYRSSNLGGPGHADQVIRGTDIENAPSLLTALNGIARDVDFVDGVPYLKLAQVTNATGSQSNPMLVVVDGVIGGAGRGGLDAIAPRTVETVEILKPNNAAIYGMAGGGGAIIITSRENISDPLTESRETAPGVFSFTPQGFYKAKEFYSPQYNVTDESKLPDNRTTIFWKPNIVTDNDGNAAMAFYNADGTGTYRVVIEGIDVNGNIGRQVFKYKVQ